MICFYSLLDESHSFIVISFINATLVLSVGETVEEVTDSGLLLNVPTIDCHQIGESSLVQVFNKQYNLTNINIL